MVIGMTKMRCMYVGLALMSMRLKGASLVNVHRQELSLSLEVAGAVAGEEGSASCFVLPVIAHTAIGTSEEDETRIGRCKRRKKSEVRSQKSEVKSQKSAMWTGIVWP